MVDLAFTICVNQKNNQNTLLMLFEKKAQLVSGHVNAKTKEKIRLKLRFLLNRYAKCIIGISNQSDDKLRFRIDQEGYKALYYVYKSSNLKNTQHYTDSFRNLYTNELEEDLDLHQSLEEHQNGPYYLFLAGRKLKKGY